MPILSRQLVGDNDKRMIVLRGGPWDGCWCVSADVSVPDVLEFKEPCGRLNVATLVAMPPRWWRYRHVRDEDVLGNSTPIYEGEEVVIMSE